MTMRMSGSIDAPKDTINSATARRGLHNLCVVSLALLLSVGLLAGCGSGGNETKSAKARKQESTDVAVKSTAFL